AVGIAERDSALVSGLSSIHAEVFQIACDGGRIETNDSHTERCYARCRSQHELRFSHAKSSLLACLGRVAQYLSVVACGWFEVRHCQRQLCDSCRLKSRLPLGASLGLNQDRADTGSRN